MSQFRTVLLATGVAMFVCVTLFAAYSRSVTAAPLSQAPVNSTTEVTIEITEDAITPALTEVEAGTTVVWHNRTGQPITIEDEFAYRLFLPSVSNPGDTAQAAQSAEPSASKTPVNFGGTIAPGRHLSHTFEQSGEFTFSVAEFPKLNGTIVVLLQALNLHQVVPDTDSGAGRELILESTVDPHTGRDGLVNFAFEVENVAGKQLDVREIRFTYYDGGGVKILEQVVSPDQIADLLLLESANDGKWWAEGKAALVGKEWTEFLVGWQDLEDKGFRILDFETYIEGGKRVYAGIFTPANYAKAALVGKEWNEFLAGWQDLEDQGFRIFDIETYVVGDTRRYAGIFRPANYAKAALVGQQWNEFFANWQNLEGQGFRIIDMEVYRSGGVTYFIGLFQPATYAKGALVGQTWNDFLSGWQGLEDDGFRIFDIEPYDEGPTTRYAGLFKPASYAKAALVNRPWPNFLQNWQNLEYLGLRMIDFEARPKNSSPVFTGLFAPGPALHWKAGTRLLILSPQASFTGQMPASMRVTVSFDNWAIPWTFQASVKAYQNQNPAKSYIFPAKQSDLARGQYWGMGSRGGHEGPKPWMAPIDGNRRSDAHRGALWGSSAGGYTFGQQYAYDMGVLDWDGDSWEFCDNDCKDNEDYNIWDTPIYAVEDGVVLYCWRGFEDNPKPGQQLPRDNGEPGGGNMFWIRHTGGEVALYAHFRKGTVPTALCPTNGLQNGTINVSKGQFLGRAGNSGSSGAPHLHFHIQDSWTDNPLDKGQSVPALFNNIEVDDRPDNQSFSWNDVNGRTFTSQSDTSSASGRTLIKIDN